MKTLRFVAMTALAMTACAFQTATAQDDKPKFSFKPSGRILVDGALFAPTGDGFADGFQLTDIRLGGKATYGNWQAKIDIGYSLGKIGMKDVYIQYDFNKHNFIRGGYFVHQFGYQAATSSSFKTAMEAPVTDTYFNATGRNLGIMYVHDKDAFFAGVSAIVGSKISDPSSNYGKVSAGGITRLVWRPIRSEGNLVQVGISAWYQSANYPKESYEVDGVTHYRAGQPSFALSAQFPTRVDKVDMLSTTVSDARSQFKLSPELALSTGRFALEAQYYYMNINRKNGLKHYQAQGAYGQLRCLLLGDRQYGYSSVDAGVALPSPKTLELVLGYNYTNGNYRQAGINAGINNDYSVTLNYYINKYMLCRLNWTYANVRDSEVMFKRHVNIIQARLQFKF